MGLIPLNASLHKQIHFFICYNFNYPQIKRYILRWDSVIKLWLSFDSVRMTAFWDIAPCSRVEVDRSFRGGYCLHHQSDETAMYFNEATRRYIQESCLHTRHRENRKFHDSLKACYNSYFTSIKRNCAHCLRYLENDVSGVGCSSVFSRFVVITQSLILLSILVTSVETELLSL
jgi:hypothetical protein